MKAVSNWSVLGLIGLLFLATPQAQARLEVSGSVSISAEADFYTPLATHGAWVEVDTYGRCWQPSGIAVEWRPYCYGEWVWTDHGWYWSSDEPWAWACYHYGRWVYHPRYHWVWVPGTEWAPAWVSWRVGGGYYGWAPLPPARLAVGFRFGGPEFVFVSSARFHAPIRPTTVIVNNTTIINKTKIVSNEPKRETRTVAGSRREVYVNNGPQPDEVAKATGRKSQPVPIQKVAARAEAPASLKMNGSSANTPAKTIMPDKKDTPEPKPNKPGPNNPVTPEKPKPKVPPERPVPPAPDQPKPVPPPEIPKPDPQTPDKPAVQDELKPGDGKSAPAKKPGPFKPGKPHKNDHGRGKP